MDHVRTTEDLIAEIKLCKSPRREYSLTILASRESDRHGVSCLLYDGQYMTLLLFLAGREHTPLICIAQEILYCWSDG